MEDEISDIRGKNTMSTLQQLKKNLIECAKEIKSNDATFGISSLPSITDTMISSMETYAKTVQQLEAAQKAFLNLHARLEREDEEQTCTEFANFDTYSDSFNELVKEDMKNVTGMESEAVVQLKKIILPNNDEEIQVEQPTRQVPKDPITKRDIKVAVKSKVCQHTFDKDGIEDYFRQMETNKRAKIQCPVAGCTNRQMTRAEIVPDEEINELIEMS